jgi:hypothetical protein
MKTRSYAFRPSGDRDGAAKPAGGDWHSKQDRSDQPKRDAAGETLPERRLRQKTEGAAAMAEHIARNNAIDQRTERLRALRLAREQAEQVAAEAAAAKPKAPKKKVRRSIS